MDSPIQFSRLRLAAFLLALAAPAALFAQTAVPVEEFTLSNGMRFLAVVRPEMTTVSAGWAARVGSANERPGITGMSHFFEHMMFKGTPIVGTTDAERDQAIIEEQEAIQERIRDIYQNRREAARLGLIDDPLGEEDLPEELVELRGAFDALVEEQRTLTVRDEFWRIYAEAGATAMNATTYADYTEYYVTVPQNRLELWFWMESERLLRPVFREFYPERDVVHEERRLRLESTPTGEFDEAFETMFWQSHPYSWPIVGRPSDLRAFTLAQAEEFYDAYYSPGNLTGALVGNFDLAEAKALAAKYFGRLEPGPEPPHVVIPEMGQNVVKRLEASCDCESQTSIHYRTVPFKHLDQYALDVLVGLLNGRSGRLYTGLVLGEEATFSPFAHQENRKLAGRLYITMDTPISVAAVPELEAAIERAVRRLVEEEIPAEEIQKVKNQLALAAWERIDSSSSLLRQLLKYDSWGDWEYLNTWAHAIGAVTAEDVQRVARKYLIPTNRAVAVYARKMDDRLPPEFVGLPEVMKQALMEILLEIRRTENRATLEEMLSKFRTLFGPAMMEIPEFQDAIYYIEQVIQDRLAELPPPEEDAR